MWIFTGILKGGTILGTSKVTTRSQVTLIEKVREKFKISEGDMIVYHEEDGEILIQKA